MGAGELNPESLTFTSAVRRQVKRDGLRVVRGRLLASEVRTVAGLPCATAARTVYDLVADGEDLSLVSAVLYDALAGGMSLYEMLKGKALLPVRAFDKQPMKSISSSMGADARSDTLFLLENLHDDLGDLVAASNDFGHLLVVVEGTRVLIDEVAGLVGELQSLEATAA